MGDARATAEVYRFVRLQARRGADVNGDLYPRADRRQRPWAPKYRPWWWEFGTFVVAATVGFELGRRALTRLWRIR